MHDKNDIDILAEAILRIFESEIRVDRNVQDFVDSTFSDPDEQTIVDILEDKENCEREPLEHLLFAPDASLQEKLEPVLEHLSLEPDDNSAVIRQVAGARARFYFPDARSFVLAVTDRRAGILVEGLRAHRRLPLEIVRAIENNAVEKQQNQIKVAFRNCRRPSPEIHHRFWVNFFTQYGPRPDVLAGHFKTALYVLDDPSDPMPQHALRRHRNFCRQALERIDRDTALRRGKNMETLMLTGHRLPHADPAEIQDRLKKIEDIYRHLFGNPSLETGDEDRQNPQQIETLKDLDDLVRRWS